ncbi:hypothetical protein ACE103_25565 [Bradyrhizobium sp. ma5]|uniref:hypothetical protein n=1 Tax=unclassified Bradyrhizobium TaxID=2631580 RepID=UPI001CC3A81F|nr:hypothetical protein [Bradyrhizobium sp. RD5-C2]GIQ78736.1 hypothetical protein BraRD5C2_71870 [Bradyrhizobium sp. RD5-C2]
MRQMIKGLIAAVAVMVTAPAMACGFNPCGYSAPVVNYGCGGCGGYGYGYGGYGAVERLPDPDAAYPGAAQQYYYVNQGPAYTGPGNWAPRPYYREGYGRPYYGYRHYGYRHHYRPYRPHYGYRYGYAPHRYGYAPHRYGHPVLRRYY